MIEKLFCHFAKKLLGCDLRFLAKVVITIFVTSRMQCKKQKIFLTLKFKIKVRSILRQILYTYSHRTDDVELIQWWIKATDKLFFPKPVQFFVDLVQRIYGLLRGQKQFSRQLLEIFSNRAKYSEAGERAETIVDKSFSGAIKVYRRHDRGPG